MSALVSPDEVLAFWVDEAGPSAWYEANDAFDQKIRDRFLKTWEAARDGGLQDWLQNARGAFAYIILTDQFPRNMFRGNGQSFETDRKALRAAKCAISKDWDLKVAEPERQFFYLPMMHSESLSDQDRCIRLIKSRMPDTGQSNLFHARAHREVIRQFGRFPYRNEALARQSTLPEQSYIADGGYGSTVQQLQNAA